MFSVTHMGLGEPMQSKCKRKGQTKRQETRIFITQGSVHMLSFCHVQAGLSGAPRRVPGTNQLWTQDKPVGCDVRDQSSTKPLGVFSQIRPEYQFITETGSIPLGFGFRVSGFSLYKSQINRKVDMTFVTARPC